ncbi:hypothetical protein Hanom_Chr03g00261401 [Helianthus anomalus]
MINLSKAQGLKWQFTLISINRDFHTMQVEETANGEDDGNSRRFTGDGKDVPVVFRDFFL